MPSEACGYHVLDLCSVINKGRDETSPVIKEFFSEKNEAYGIIKGPDDQSPIEVTENVAYSTMEQQPSLNTPPVYETIIKIIIIQLLMSLLYKRYLFHLTRRIVPATHY